MFRARRSRGTRKLRTKHGGFDPEGQGMMFPRELYLAFAFIAAALLFVARSARSEIGGVHVDMTPYGGYADWAREINLENKHFLGGKLGIGFGRFMGVEGYYGWGRGRTEYGTGDSLFQVSRAVSSTPSSEVDIQHYGADLYLNLIPKSFFDPYVFGGYHEEKITNDAADVRQFMNGAEFGGGVRFKVASRSALRFEIVDKLWSFDSPPAPQPPGDDNLHNLWYLGGIQVSLGGAHPKDSDHDGVPDRDDQCPGTPEHAIVDRHGCPIDSDHDGVPDGIDQCPNTPAGVAVDARGCPIDSDGDGVPDQLDQCPNTPAGVQVDTRGCPLDSDGDGVPDQLDQCPNTPAGTQVDARGCPVDSDHDGVADDKDLCPNTPPNVKVDKDGCPIELSVRETELLDKGRITTREVHFVTAKWDILPESKPVLDDIGRILIQWPRLRIEVGGHTDARGTESRNMDLSQRRAQAVLDYLVAHFPQIRRDQYTARGYGERVPVASNRSIEGMAMNRRVEFKVLNPEELTKERERRRLLQRGE